jgi:hypothetical protein
MNYNLSNLSKTQNLERYVQSHIFPVQSARLNFIISTTKINNTTLQTGVIGNSIIIHYIIQIEKQVKRFGV